MSDRGPLATRLAPSVVAALLSDARGLIERGWTQGAYVRSAAGWACAVATRGEVRRACAAGAVDRIGAVNGLTIGEREQLRAVLLAQLGLVDTSTDPFSLERWNDQPQRRREDVLELYDAAIASLA